LKPHFLAFFVPEQTQQGVENINFALGHMFGISSGFGATLYQDHKLIRNGPYRFVRHPMYLAVILAAFGALLIFRARQEERLLAEEFGEEWQRYRRDVPGWLPTLRKRVK
jgi:protein-S-isoprenylcysteine O-methyltransferase Ste14